MRQELSVRVDWVLPRHRERVTAEQHLILEREVEFREVQYVGDEAACRSERRDVVLGAGWDELRADGIRRREAAEKIDVALGRLASRELREAEVWGCGVGPRHRLHHADPLDRGPKRRSKPQACARLDDEAERIESRRVVVEREASRCA